MVTGIKVHEVAGIETGGVLTPEALEFVARLERQFGAERRRLLARRREVQGRLNEGWRPGFLDETAAVRAEDWSCAAIPSDLRRRQVEITGPAERKLMINALNSGADVFMADLEDSSAPTWANVIAGQENLRDAARGTIGYTAPETGKVYALGESPAVLMVRPRGWHLEEAHVEVDGAPVSASLLDFGLFFFHNARTLLERGTGPYFYLPKLESHLEARLWSAVFLEAQAMLGLRPGTIRATVLIETILAAFEMDEILYELREHSAGLNCGRWDYIFSFIKKFQAHAGFVLPDRDQVKMTSPCMEAYGTLLIQTCHRRGVHAMGGMAAQIPIKGDAAANEAALARVRADKAREVKLGHDGTWVAHPGLVAIAREAFEGGMAGDNQLERSPTREVSAEQLLAVPEGTITEAGVRHNVQVGVRYLAAWLGGSGCVPLYNVMEDAATAEICRTQLWQWRHHEAVLESGAPITTAWLTSVIDAELASIEPAPGAAGEVFRELVLSESLEEFLTLPAYQRLIEVES